MPRFAKIIAALGPLLLLTSCLLTPGKFVSALDIRADRSFTYSYQGEVIATDFSKSLPDVKDEGSDTKAKNIAYTKLAAADTKADAKARENDTKMQAIAAALSNEIGYRSVKYVGNNKLLIDYQISGKLDRGYVFPYNMDAEAVFPFLIIEVRNDGKARVQAPGFANSSEKSGGMGSGGMDAQAKLLDGVFTLTTNAEIVSQNQEDGATDSPRGKQIVWKVNQLTKTAPMATLRFAAGK